MSEHKLILCPMTLKDAIRFVELHHRHHPTTVGGLFSVGVSRGEEIAGCAIVGRPVSRMLQNGWTAEVTRLCVLENAAVPRGHRDACSMLYAAAWRAAKAIGYRQMITYTLESEPGTSLRAAGWRLVAEVRGRSWSCKSRPRFDKHPLQGKLRWEA